MPSTPRTHQLLFVMACDSEHSAVIRAGKRVPSLYRFIPLSIPLLAALTPPQFQVRFVNEFIRVPERYPEDVDLVAISFLTPNACRAYELADFYRSKGVTVVMGGIHATALPDEALEHADAVALGEGEEIWPEILDDFSRGRLKPRYQAPRPVPMDQVPFPDWSVLDGGRPNSVQTSRGCRYRCDFCNVAQYFGRELRHRPVQQVVEEIGRLGRSGGRRARNVVFKDDNIVGDRDYALELFRALEPLRIRWVAQGNLRAFDEELLALAAKSGCLMILAGLESADAGRVRKLGKSHAGFAELKRSVDQFHRHGIALWGTFIFGFDEDGPEVFRHTCRHADALGLDYVGFNILTPLPGTELYERLEKEGRLLTSDWWRYDFEHVVFQPRRMTAQQLEAGYVQAYRHCFSWPSIIRRMAALVLRSLRTRRLLPLHYFFLLNWAFRLVAFNRPQEDGGTAEAGQRVTDAGVREAR